MISLLLTATLAYGAPAPESLSDLYRALSQRHDPGCEAVEATTADPVHALLEMTERQMPPWVPIRAAACLATRHTDAVRPQLDSWVTDPQTKGLMLTVMGLLDAMPPEHAHALADLAVTRGSDPAAARLRILRADDPALRAIAEVNP
jgi:hypothetical protein